jgi:hypothetical protein
MGGPRQPLAIALPQQKQWPTAQRERPYQAGRSRHWVKVKNRKHPAMYRVMDALA